MQYKDIFISYKSEDFEDANWVRSVLENNGISCWMAPMSIPGGSSYATEIPAAIKNCKVFVLILTEKSQLSKWVPRELDQAINENKIIMPFMLENCALKDDFNFYLTNVQRYAAYENKSKAMEKMVSEIKAVIGISPVENTPTSETLTEKSNKSPVHYNTKKIKKHLKGRLILGFTALALIIAIVVSFGVILSPSDQPAPFSEPELSFDANSTSINLSDTSVSSAQMEEISKMEKLEFLRFENCTFEDDDLSQMFVSSLRSLTVANCALTSSQLAQLNFSQAQLTSLSLTGNTELTSTDIITELSDTLTYLDLSQNNISDISALENCKLLTILLLDENQISDLRPLTGCTKLQQLSLNSNKLASLDGLEHCIELNSIYAAKNEITSIDGLQNATVLKTVYLSSNKISSIETLKKSGAVLENLYLDNNSIEDNLYLDYFPSLRYVNLDNNKLTGLSVEICQNLIALSASNNGITFFDPAPVNIFLEYLDLSFNDLDFLGLLSPLTFKDSDGVFLNMFGNDISYVDIAYDFKYSLLALPEYESLEYLSNASAETVILSYSPYFDYTQFDINKCDKYVFSDCPLDTQMAFKILFGNDKTNFINSSDADLTPYISIPDELKVPVKLP